MGWRVQWNGLSPSTGISLTWPVAHILYTAHCPFNVLCIVCVLHKIYQCPKYTLLVIQVLKVIAHYPLNIANCPLHPGNDWSPTVCPKSVLLHNSRSEFLSPGLAALLVLLLLGGIANCCEYAHISPRHVLFFI